MNCSLSIIVPNVGFHFILIKNTARYYYFLQSTLTQLVYFISFIFILKKILIVIWTLQYIILCSSLLFSSKIVALSTLTVSNKMLVNHKARILTALAVTKNLSDFYHFHSENFNDILFCYEW